MDDWRVSWSDFLLKIRGFENQFTALPTSVKKLFTEEEVHFKVPKIVLIGGVGVGKTSVLERLVGSENFKLPKGIGGITRQVMSLKSASSSSSSSSSLVSSERVKLDNKVMISDKNKSESTSNQRRSELIPDELEFIDLPGFHRIPLSGQAENIENITLNQMKMYTEESDENENETKNGKEKGNLLILILPADCEIVNSDVLQLVKEEIDPYGQRTIICLTKLDLLEDVEDDSVSRLNYTISQVFNCRAVVAVINAGQLHINDKISAIASEETDFFSRINYCEQYKTGIEQLRGEIISALKERGNLFKRNLATKLESYKSRLEGIVSAASDPNLNVNLITKYIDNVTNQIEGNHQMVKFDCLDSHVLTTGSKIKIFLNESFPEAINSIDPISGLDTKQLEIILKNSQGLVCNVLSNSEKCLKFLIKKQIEEKYKGLIDECFRMVLDEMKKLVVIPGIRIKSKTMSTDEDEFYDVTSETDDDDEEGLDLECDIIEYSFDYSTSTGGFKNAISSYSKPLAESINSAVYKVLEEQSDKTRKLMNDFVEMETENIFYYGEEDDLWQMYKEYNFSTIRKRSQSQTFLTNTNTNTPSQSQSHSNSSSSCSLSLEEEEDSITLTPIDKNSFLKEFRALLFQPNPFKNKRVEYRPSKPPTQIQREEHSHAQSLTITSSTSTTQNDTYKEEISFLLSILRIYLMNFRRRLLDFVPKALMHFLIRATVKEVSLAVLPLGRGGRNDHNVMREEVKGMKNIIDRISKLIIIE